MQLGIIVGLSSVLFCCLLLCHIGFVFLPRYSKHSQISFQHFDEYITKNIHISRFLRHCFYLFIDGPGSSISFTPANQSITKNLNGSLGPIICSAQCNPQCQFHWIKPDGTVVDGSKLEISHLSKDDHGTFTCHAGNGYGHNATKNILLTVNCKYLMFNAILSLVKKCKKISRLKCPCLPFNSLEYFSKTTWLQDNDYWQYICLLRNMLSTVCITLRTSCTF